MNVATILKSKGRVVSTARADATLMDLSCILAAKKIGAIVVIGEQGKIDGIMSERDVIRAIAERGADIRNEEVFLRADTGVSYGKVVEVMSEIRNAGGKNSAS